MKRETTILLMTTLALVMAGLLMVYSISAVKSPSMVQFRAQLKYAAAGIAALLFFAHVDYHYYRRGVVYRGFAEFVLALLALVLIPGIGVESGGAQRWLRIAHFQFQPSEFAKLAVILLLAAKLTENQKDIRSFRHGFFPPLFIAFVFAVLIVCENDLGMPVTIMAIAFAMLFAAGTKWRYLVGTAAPVVALAGLLAVTSVHRLTRLLVYLDPWKNPTEDSYQLAQSLTAFARGALWGCGLGSGEQKLSYLPAAHTDFIFAIFGEEMGLIGTVTLATLYAVLTIAAFRVAINAKDLFGSLLASGIASIIAFQSAFVIAMTTGLVPTKGFPLPFVSYGGTSLIVFLSMMGILINVGRQAQEPQERPLFAKEVWHTRQAGFAGIGTNLIQ